jgi:hypothetical protein
MRKSSLFEDLFVWDDEKSYYRLKDDSIVHSFYIQKLLEQIHLILEFQRFDDICGGLHAFTEKALRRSWRIPRSEFNESA